MYPKFTSPRILALKDQKRLLRVERAHASPRDGALLSLALGTGLRLRELRGLNVGRSRRRSSVNRTPVPQSSRLQSEMSRMTVAGERMDVLRSVFGLPSPRLVSGLPAAHG